MLVKKPNILLSACSSLHSVPAVSGSSTSLCSRREEGTRHRRHDGLKARGYATIAGEVGENPDQQEQQEHVWPRPTKDRLCPTPYQIFAMKDNAQYSKARFYELVKIYHPDLSAGSAAQEKEQQIRLERYRLLVAAHTILSDPTKRSAYDRFGAGWDGRAEVGARDTWQQPSPYHAPGPFSQSWSSQSDPIWQNATWEDWERFHAHKARERGEAGAKVAKDFQAPTYMRNSYFLALVAMLAMAGSSVNYNRAQDAGAYFVEQRDMVHDKAAKDLRKVRQDLSGITNRQERIEFFLRQREATMGLMAATDVDALREEKANRLLSDREVCRSEEVSEKDT